MRKVLSGLMHLVLLPVLLGLFSVSPSFSEEVVTGQKTTDNFLPGMSGFDRSGSTSVGTGQGCSAGEFCTGGTQGGGGTFSKSFNLQDKMTIDDINRGFKLDYSLDVDSHSSNTNVDSCTNGILQGTDCKDIFKVTLSLFSAGSVLEHKFIDEIELDYSGIRNFAFQQNIPENEFTELKGDIELFGIDAGFPNKFFGPQFSNPGLTTTFDIVSFIETEIIDILTNTDLISDNPIVSVEVDLAPPPPEPEVVAAETEIEAQFEQGMRTSIVPPVEFSQESVEDSSEATSAQTEVEEEIQQEVSVSGNENDQREEASEDQNEQKPKVVVKKAVKEKIAKQIIKRMGSSGRYDSGNQIKTLVVMQVLADSKSFFKSPVTLQDKKGFFDDGKIPDSTITDNNFAQYVLFGGSSRQHDTLMNLQWKR